jgi:Zn finger protein HypA/HybF involved in hydrogenase expression
MAAMARQKGRRLLGLDLVAGAWSGADPESLQFALGLLVAESEWPEAEVRIRSEPLALRCRRCERRFQPPETDLRCPDCRSAEVETLQGMDLRLESIEVE